MDWYKLSKDEMISQLETNQESGLTNDEITSRLQKYGHNELQE